MDKNSKSTASKKEAVETLEVRFLLSPSGKFGLAYSEGETGTFPAIQATELVEAKYAEFVK